MHCTIFTVKINTKINGVSYIELGQSTQQWGGQCKIKSNNNKNDWPNSFCGRSIRTNKLKSTCSASTYFDNWEWYRVSAAGFSVDPSTFIRVCIAP